MNDMNVTRELVDAVGDAFNDNKQGTPSAAGEALQRLPPIVPEF